MFSLIAYDNISAKSYYYVNSRCVRPLPKNLTTDALKSLCASLNFIHTCLKNWRQTLFGVAKINMILWNICSIKLLLQSLNQHLKTKSKNITRLDQYWRTMVCGPNFEPFTTIGNPRFIKKNKNHRIS